MDAWVSRFADSRYRHERASATVEMQPLLRPWHNAIPSWLTGRLSKRDAKGRKTSIDGRQRLATIVETHTPRTNAARRMSDFMWREGAQAWHGRGWRVFPRRLNVHLTKRDGVMRMEGGEVLMRLDEHESVWCRVINKCGETVMKWEEILVIESGVKGDCLSFE